MAESNKSVLEDLCFDAGKPSVKEILLNLPESHRDKTTVLQPHSSEVGFINHMLILKLSKLIIQRQDS
ncbi:hypothetical protein Tco_0742949 [Tanacetum coccineum]